MKLFDVYPLFNITPVKAQAPGFGTIKVKNTSICMVVMPLFPSDIHIRIM